MKSFFVDILSRPSEYVLASRPWSFTAAIIPILLTTAVLKQSYFSVAFARVLLMGTFIQAVDQHYLLTYCCNIFT